MYEAMNYETLLERMLARVEGLDTSEGSVIMTALAPAAALLAQAYMDLDTAIDLSFADTADGEFLERRAKELGIARSPATKAICIASFLDGSGSAAAVDIGSRWNGGEVNYRVIEAVSGGYRVECETAGTAGNGTGPLSPVDYAPGVASAAITAVESAGKDVESDEELRGRYFDRLTAFPFAGNYTAYREMCEAQKGVTGCRLETPNTANGAVNIFLIGEDYLPASSGVVSAVQDVFTDNRNGLGLAPVGHLVTVAAAESLAVALSATLTLEADADAAAVKAAAQAAYENYLMELRRDWSERAAVVRVAQVTLKLLQVPGVTDVSDVKLNGGTVNITLDNHTVPVSGGVSFV